MPYSDVIRKGATYYREVILYRPANPLLPYSTTNRELVPLAGKTPRSYLMKSANGQKVADFPCAILAATGDDPAADGYLPQRIAQTMPRATTATLNTAERYIANIDLDDGETTDPGPRYLITVESGNAP